MSETMTLADSVRDAILAAMKANRWTPSDEDAFWVTTEATLADIAACERLAKAAAEPYDHDDQQVYDAVCAEFDDALAAYREEVARG